MSALYSTHLNITVMCFLEQKGQSFVIVQKRQCLYDGYFNKHSQMNPGVKKDTGVNRNANKLKHAIKRIVDWLVSSLAQFI